MEEKSVCSKRNLFKHIQYGDAFSLLETVNKRTNENAIMQNFSAWVFKCTAKWYLLSFLQRREHFLLCQYGIFET